MSDNSIKANKSVEVTGIVKVDNHTHAGKEVRKGDKITLRSQEQKTRLQKAGIVE